MVGTIYASLRKTFQALGLTRHVALFSYKDHFSFLWEVCNDDEKSAKVKDSKDIWCVVDDGDGTIKRLHIGIWGRYFRAKHIANAPKIVLLGRDESLNPRESGGLNISVPDFYEDPGLRALSFFCPNLLDKIINFAQQSENRMASKDQIAGFQALVYRTLTAEGSHHAVSNEIAPAILKGALSEMFDTQFTDSGSDQESRALLKLWEWSAAFLQPGSSSMVSHETPKDKLVKYKMDDIWRIWSNARYLLIDDQAVSHGYEDIIRHSLEIMTGGDGFRLTSKTSIMFGDDGDIAESEIDDILNNCDCLFLDIRMGNADQKEMDYEKLTGIRTAKKIYSRDRSFPIIIFSSSQKREIENILSRYRNVITGFRKPGIAGSIESIDGTVALDSLFSAINKAFCMQENRLLYKKFEAFRNNRPPYEIECRGKYRKKWIKFAFSQDDAQMLFEQVFWDERYDKAFHYPYSYFEQLFKDVKESLKQIRKLEIGAVDSTKHLVRNISDRPIKIESLKPLRESKLREFMVTNLNLASDEEEEIKENVLKIHMKALAQLRNLSAHGVRDFSAFRREAIIVLSLFVDTVLINKKQLVNRFDDSVKKGLGNQKLEKRNRTVYYPLTRTFDLKETDCGGPQKLDSVLSSNSQHERSFA